MDNVIYTGVMFALTLAGFLLGKYVFPKIPADVTEKLTSLSAWAKEFVVWAKDFLVDKSGEDKMAEVIKKLQEVAAEAGWNVTEDQLKAIAQSAYNAMIAAEKEKEKQEDTTTAATMPLEALAAPTIVINTPAATVSTEGVAIATDNVPDGALEENPDGTVNAYDETGKKVGTMPKEAVEAAASAVTSVIVEE